MKQRIVIHILAIIFTFWYNLNSCAQNFVTVNGAKFMLKGADNVEREFKFIGANIPKLTNLGGSNKDDRIRTQLKEVKAMSGTVIRLFVGINSDGGNDAIIERINRVLNVAKEPDLADLKFIICLTNKFCGYGVNATDQQNGCYTSSNNTSACEDGTTKSILKPDWFVNGNAYNGFVPGTSVTPGCPNNDPDWTISCCSCPEGYWRTYTDLIDDLGNAFGNNTQIFSWELGNELQVPWANRDALLQFLYFSSYRLRVCRGVKQLISTGFESVYKAFGDFDNEKAGFKDVPTKDANGNIIGKLPGDSEAQVLAKYNTVKNYIAMVYDKWVVGNKTYYSKFDYVTVHAYNNQWNNQGMQIDALWAKKNNKPWIMGEGLFSLPSCESLGHISWRVFQDEPQTLPVPFNHSSYTTVSYTFPGPVNRRCDATDDFLFQILANNYSGCKGYLQWGFNASNAEPSLNMGCEGMVKNSEDYNTLWTTLFQSNWYVGIQTECLTTDMDIPGLGTDNFICTTTKRLTLSTPTAQSQLVRLAASQSIQIKPGFYTRSNSAFSAIANTQTCTYCTGTNREPEQAADSQFQIQNDAGLSVAPNPSSTHFVVKYLNFKSETAQVFLHNVVGELVSKINISLTGSGEAGEFILDASSLSPGIYTCSMQTGSALKAVKVIKL